MLGEAPETLAEILVNIGIDRITMLMAYEEARYLGAWGFALILCNNMEIHIIIERIGFETLRIREVRFNVSKDQLELISLRNLGWSPVRISQQGGRASIVVEVSGTEQAINVLKTMAEELGYRNTGLKLCGYEVLEEYSRRR